MDSVLINNREVLVNRVDEPEKDLSATEEELENTDLVGDREVSGVIKELWEKDFDFFSSIKKTAEYTKREREVLADFAVESLTINRVLSVDRLKKYYKLGEYSESPDQPFNEFDLGVQFKSVLKVISYLSYHSEKYLEENPDILRNTNFSDFANTLKSFKSLKKEFILWYAKVNGYRYDFRVKKLREYIEQLSKTLYSLVRENKEQNNTNVATPKDFIGFLESADKVNNFTLNHFFDTVGLADLLYEGISPELEGEELIDNLNAKISQSKTLRDFKLKSPSKSFEKGLVNDREYMILKDAYFKVSEYQKDAEIALQKTFNIVYSLLQQNPSLSSNFKGHIDESQKLLGSVIRDLKSFEDKFEESFGLNKSFESAKKYVESIVASINDVLASEPLDNKTEDVLFNMKEELEAVKTDLGLLENNRGVKSPSINYPNLMEVIRQALIETISSLEDKKSSLEGSENLNNLVASAIGKGSKSLLDVEEFKEFYNNTVSEFPITEILSQFRRSSFVKYKAGIETQILDFRGEEGLYNAVSKGDQGFWDSPDAIFANISDTYDWEENIRAALENIFFKISQERKKPVKDASGRILGDTVAFEYDEAEASIISDLLYGTSFQERLDSQFSTSGQNIEDVREDIKDVNEKIDYSELLDKIIYNTEHSTKYSQRNQRTRYLQRGTGIQNFFESLINSEGELNKDKIGNLNLEANFVNQYYKKSKEYNSHNRRKMKDSKGVGVYENLIQSFDREKFYALTRENEKGNFAYQDKLHNDPVRMELLSTFDQSFQRSVKLARANLKNSLALAMKKEKVSIIKALELENVRLNQIKQQALKLQDAQLKNQALENIESALQDNQELLRDTQKFTESFLEQRSLTLAIFDGYLTGILSQNSGIVSKDNDGIKTQLFQRAKEATTVNEKTKKKEGGYVEYSSELENLMLDQISFFKDTIGLDDSFDKGSRIIDVGYNSFLTWLAKNNNRLVLFSSLKKPKNPKWGKISDNELKAVFRSDNYVGNYLVKGKDISKRGAGGKSNHYVNLTELRELISENTESAEGEVLFKQVEKLFDNKSYLFQMEDFQEDLKVVRTNFKATVVEPHLKMFRSVVRNNIDLDSEDVAYLLNSGGSTNYTFFKDRKERRNTSLSSVEDFSSDLKNLVAGEDAVAEKVGELRQNLQQMFKSGMRSSSGVELLKEGALLSDKETGYKVSDFNNPQDILDYFNNGILAYEEVHNQLNVIENKLEESGKDVSGLRKDMVLYDSLSRKLMKKEWFKLSNEEFDNYDKSKIDADLEKAQKAITKSTKFNQSRSSLLSNEKIAKTYSLNSLRGALTTLEDKKLVLRGVVSNINTLISNAENSIEKMGNSTMDNVISNLKYERQKGSLASKELKNSIKNIEKEIKEVTLGDNQSGRAEKQLKTIVKNMETQLANLKEEEQKYRSSLTIIDKLLKSSKPQKDLEQEDLDAINALKNKISYLKSLKETVTPELKTIDSKIEDSKKRIEESEKLIESIDATLEKGYFVESEYIQKFIASIREKLLSEDPENKLRPSDIKDQLRSLNTIYVDYLAYAEARAKIGAELALLGSAKNEVMNDMKSLDFEF